MILALVAALLIVAAYAVFQHYTIRRLLAAASTVEADAQPSETEAGSAILELIEAKLTECPDEWRADAGMLTHIKSGLTIVESAGTIMVRHKAIGFLVPDAWKARVLAACQLRNAKEVVEALER